MAIETKSSMQADNATRQRILTLIAVIGCLLGGLAISGPLERFFARNPAQEEPSKEEINPKRIAEMREHATRLRATRDQAARFGQQGQWLKAADIAGSLISEDDRNRFGLLAMKGEALFRAGETQKSIEVFRKILIGKDPVSIAGKLALQGDRVAYKAHCESFLADRKNTKDQSSLRINPGADANNLAWMCILLRDGLTDYSLPITLAREALNRAGSTERSAGRTDGRLERALYLNTLGVALYRAGDDANAIQALAESERVVKDPFNWPFLALAYFRQGNKAESQKWLLQLRKLMIDTFGTDQNQNNRHELLLFHREAEMVINGTYPPAKSES